VRRSLPYYIDGMSSPNVPDWARVSVLAFREGDEVRQAIDEVVSAAARNPSLEAFLPSLHVDLEALRPSEVRRSASRRDRDPAVRDGIKILVDDFTTRFDVSSMTAFRYCCGIHRRIHHYKYLLMSQVLSANWSGPAGDRKIPQAVVKRIFGSSRSKKAPRRLGALPAAPHHRLKTRLKTFGAQLPAVW